MQPACLLLPQETQPPDAAVPPTRSEQAPLASATLATAASQSAAQRARVPTGGERSSYVTFKTPDAKDKPCPMKLTVTGTGGEGCPDQGCECGELVLNEGGVSVRADGKDVDAGGDGYSSRERKP